MVIPIIYHTTWSLLCIERNCIMRISGIQNYSVYSNNSKQIQKKGNRIMSPATSNTPNFQGCNAFKVVGLVAGAAAVVVLAPGLAAVGLAGLGALPGMVLGAAVDEKIDEINAYIESRSNDEGSAIWSDSNNPLT